MFLEPTEAWQLLSLCTALTVAFLLAVHFTKLKAKVPLFYSWIGAIAIFGGALAFLLPIALNSGFGKDDDGRVLRQLILYTTGGVLGVITLGESHRKNNQEKEKNENDHTRQVYAERRSRYTKAVEQLADEKATVRLGGIYTLVGLIDEWLTDDTLEPEERQKEGQVIINNLCSYIRSPFPLAEEIEEYQARKELEKFQKSEFEKLSEEESSRLQVLLKRFKDSDEYEKPKDITADYAKFHEEQDVRRTIFVEMSKRSSLFTKNEKGNVTKTIPGTWSDFDFDFSRAPIFYPLNAITIEKGNFYSAKFYSNANFIEVTFAHTADFRRAIFTRTANFSEASFAQTVNFSEATFARTANFIGTTFAYTADFRRVTFTRTANFSEVAFIQTVNFNKAAFTQTANFRRATFAQRANFSEATFAHTVSFNGATFAQTVNFIGASFTRRVNFSGATFAQTASFNGVTFDQTANFIKATFAQTASFNGATFAQTVNFIEVTFAQRANFSKVTFIRPANFSKVTFVHDANFIEATFAQRADFIGATFTQMADFRGATFTQMANFWQATFTQMANFSRATFAQRANFGEATFTQMAGFRGATFTKSVNFSNTTFKNHAPFFARMNLRARFSVCSVQEDYSFKVSESHRPIRTEQITVADGRVFTIPVGCEIFDPEPLPTPKPEEDKTE